MGEEALFLSEAVRDTALVFCRRRARRQEPAGGEVERRLSPATRPSCASSPPSSWDNAVKYANAGGEVTVCLRGGRHPVLTVENDCRNVDELPSRLFDCFYRLLRLHRRRW